MSDIERNKAIARRSWEEIFPACDVEALAQVVDPDVVSRGRRPDEPTGFEGVKRTMLWMASVFSDQRWDVHDVIGEGDVVATRVTHHGRHTGELMGIPPTGREVAYQYALRKGAYVIESPAEIVAPFQRAGFEVNLADEGGGQAERQADRPSSTAGLETYRMRLVAKKR